MPDEKVIPFRPRIVETVPAPAAPMVEASPNEVREVLTAALEYVDANPEGFRRVFIIFEGPEEIDFMYSTTTDPEKLWLVEKARAWIMGPPLEEIEE